MIGPFKHFSQTALALAGLLAVAACRAQCVSAYPHLEDFEAAPIWTISGVSPDWAWGTPAHPLINSAGGGTKSWCVGGLTGTFYNLGEQSWIQSGCYDMTTLDHPWVSFKIFWETERQYDGANLQYSLNGGATWNNVGAYGDSVDCLNDNWYNEDDVTNLTAAFPSHGWSGRVGATSGSCVGGFGSGAWIEAKHCVQACANQPDVRFRFLFGAGTTCNNYDGVAIDDFLVDDGQLLVPIGWECFGDSVQYDTNEPCYTYAWDFDDPASGALNTSTSPDPGHVFTGPGLYNVSVVISGPCGIVDTLFVPFDHPGLDLIGTDPLCNGGTGSATAMILGGLPSTNFQWITTGDTTLTITGLTPGTYVASVWAQIQCPNLDSVVISEPPPLFVVAQADTSICPGSSIDLEASGSGGTPGYTYQWSPVGPTVTPVSDGTYSVVAVDANGCISAADDVNVDVLPPVIASFTLDPEEGCAPLCVTFTQLGGAGGSNIWDFGDGTTAGNDPAPEHCYEEAGLFDVVLTVTDTNGCSGILAVDSAVQVFAPPVAGFLADPQVASINDPLIEFTDASIDAAEWWWSFGDPSSTHDTLASPVFQFPDVGCYTVVQLVTDVEGCTDSTSMLVCVEDEFALYVPNAFTPDGDGINDNWLPMTTVFFPKEYSLEVYDRWGVALFTTTDVSQAWDGDATPLGVYVWKVRLRGSDGLLRESTGHVALIR